MNSFLGISLLLLQLFNQISAVKFGFFLSDEGGVLNKKFVAFGSIPESTDEQYRIDISDSLNRFYHYHRKGKQGIDLLNSIKFNVNLFKQTVLADGSYQVALKGELSSFLALFRLSTMNSVQASEAWKTAKFYSDPIVIMKKEDFQKAKHEIRVILIIAAFDNFDIVPNSDLAEFQHQRTMSQAAKKDESDVFDFSAYEEDDSRYTVLEFHSSTGSLQNPLFDSSTKKSFVKPKNHKKSTCCSPCTIS